jgi:hypothetical protein
MHQNAGMGLQAFEHATYDDPFRIVLREGKPKLCASLQSEGSGG